MRDIKVRAWDNVHKKMITVENYECTEIIDEDEFYKTPFELFLMALKWMQKKDYILMQYTGLKDKNGKEIYEGDVVIALFYEEKEPFKYTIEWVNAGFRLCKEPHSGYPLDIHGLHDIEIIGNIYENPELLKEGGRE